MVPCPEHSIYWLYSYLNQGPRHMIIGLPGAAKLSIGLNLGLNKPPTGGSAFAGSTIQGAPTKPMRLLGSQK